VVLRHYRYFYLWTFASSVLSRTMEKQGVYHFRANAPVKVVNAFYYGQQSEYTVKGDGDGNETAAGEVTED
jgi:hypothetical protein